MKWSKFKDVQPKSGVEVLLYTNTMDCEVYTLGAYFRAGEVLEEFIPFEGQKRTQRMSKSYGRNINE